MDAMTSDGVRPARAPETGATVMSGSSGRGGVRAGAERAGLDPLLSARFAMVHEVTERTRAACERVLAALREARACGSYDPRTPGAREAMAELRELSRLRRTAFTVAAEARRGRPAARGSARPEPAGDARRTHYGVLSDEMIVAPVVAGMSYRRAAAELSALFGRRVTKRQVEEAVNRAGGLRALRARSAG
jgi:hypothetical protein